MPQNITIIGDSTIDNRVWVEGIKKAFIKEKLGLKVHDAQTHVRQSRRLIGKPKLSVVENLMKLMSVGYQINDLTNDGFTTADVLYGEYRDKVFGVSTFPQRFPHVAFSPLEDGAEAIQNANVIILSIGGNDFREFLMAALRHAGAARQDYIKRNFASMLSTLKNNYLEIITKIREKNQYASIILLTQYYPSTTQNNYHLYPFMNELVDVLGLDKEAVESVDVIHVLIQRLYKDIFASIEDSRLSVADIASSLNPLDDHNYVSQIEPSANGGLKIAKMLKHVIHECRYSVSGFVYRFYPSFFDKTNNANDQPAVTRTMLKDWTPVHPWNVNNCYSKEEERVYQHYQADELSKEAMLEKLHRAIINLDEENSLYKPANDVFDEVRELCTTVNGSDSNKLKMTVALTLNLLETKPENTPAYQSKIQLLKDHAERSAIGVAPKWKRVLAATIILASVALILACIVGACFMGVPFIVTGIAAAGTLFGGVGLFAMGGKKSLAKDAVNFAKAAQEAFRR